MAEATIEIFSSILSKANLIHDVGVADHCNNLCPELVVLSDEIRILPPFNPKPETRNC